VNLDPCVADMLAERYGLDVKALGEAAVERAVRRRMALTGETDPCAYARRAVGSPAEIDALVDEIAVPETWFFRDGDPFDFLYRWAAERAPGELRALSAGCATGQEAYSIAAALLAAGARPEQVRVLGVDFSREAVAKARHGCYEPRIPRPEIPPLYRRFFSVAGGTVAVAQELKKVVEFDRANLIAPGFLAEQRFDVVFCRNVMIYLTPRGRAALLENLERVLADGGILFVGGAESQVIPGERFVSAGIPGAFLRRDRPAARAVDRPAGRPAPAGIAASVIEWPRVDAEAPPATIAEAVRLADAGRLEEAERICRLRISAGAPDPEAYFLLGLLAQERDRLEEAESLFRKALYLEPGHERALRQLALLAERRGDDNEARLLRRRAMRVRAKSGTQ